MPEQSLQTRIQAWWNDNPFIYSFEKTEPDLTPHFFAEINRKFIKWTPWTQTDDRPLSGVIDFTALKGKRVLDIAIGTGWSTERFVRAGAVATGLDLTPKAIEISKVRFKQAGLPEPELIVGDAQHLPFAEGTFDFVLAWGCLMHMPDTQQAINEIHRVLKPGGKAAAMMYNKHSLHWWYYIFLSKGILRGKLLSMSRQELSNRYTDGVYQGGNQLTKFFSSNEVGELFKKFTSCQVSVHDTTTPIDHFPHRRLPLGSLLPRRWREYLATKFGQSLWIQVTK